MLKHIEEAKARDAKIDQFIAAQTTFNQSTQQDTNNLKASIHNLEVQVGQLAKQVGDRDKGKLPSTSMINPKESVMAISCIEEEDFDSWDIPCGEIED